MITTGNPGLISLIKQYVVQGCEAATQGMEYVLVGLPVCALSYLSVPKLNHFLEQNYETGHLQASTLSSTLHSNHDLPL